MGKNIFFFKTIYIEEKHVGRAYRKNMEIIQNTLKIEEQFSDVPNVLE